jgi:hypothetical protein
MKHCHLSIMSNELTFLKRKLPFLYENFDQIIFVDYDIVSKGNSTDGTIEYIEKFEDVENKITLLKFSKKTEVDKFRGQASLEKQKMFGFGSKYVNDDINIVWATDMDEFFERDLIDKVENEFEKDSYLQTIDLPHKVFIYNEHNFFDVNDFYIAPRITKHKKGQVYGHCDFDKYGKTIALPDEFLYHYAFVGYNRCMSKQTFYGKVNFGWLESYSKFLSQGDKYITIKHPANHRSLVSKPYLGSHPEYLDITNMCEELNRM